MQINSTTVITILGMAVVTYATRIAGLWLMKRGPSQRMMSWLCHIPGAILISIVAPAVLNGSLADVLAALTTVFMAIRTGNLVLTMLTGVGTVWILRILKV